MPLRGTFIKKTTFPIIHTVASSQKMLPPVCLFSPGSFFFFSVIVKDKHVWLFLRYTHGRFEKHKLPAL